MRVVEPEVLDALAPDHPAARRARHDLQRLHAVMRTRAIVARQIDTGLPPAPTRPLQILELGAGDGTLMLGVARRLAARGWRARFALLDRAPCVDAATRGAYARLGWDTSVLAADVRDGCESARDGAVSGWWSPRRWDIVVTTLFLHHFEGAALAALVRAIAQATGFFVACEPRRSAWALAASHLVVALGAGPVTRRDAVLSVRAGFAGNELSALWPCAEGCWRLHEAPAAPFSHCFSAARRDGDEPLV